MAFEPLIIQNLLRLGLWEQAEFYAASATDPKNYITVNIKKANNQTYAYYLSEGVYIGMRTTV